MSDKPIHPDIASDKLAEFEDAMKNIPQRQHRESLSSFERKLDEAEIANLYGQLSAMTQRAEAAEARIREAQEQEPVFTRKHPSGDFMQSLYASPIPPADVAELQRKYDELSEISKGQQSAYDGLCKENADLTLKLAKLEQAAQDEINRLEDQKLRYGY